MATAGIGGDFLAEVEGRVLDIEEGLRALQLSGRSRPVKAVQPVRPARLGVWPLTTLLAIFGTAAVIGPFLLVLAS